MVIHLKELEVGLCYRDGDAEYLCLYKTSNIAVMLCYEYSHFIGTLEFWNEEELLNYNLEIVSDYPLTEYIDKLKFVDNQNIKYKD